MIPNKFLYDKINCIKHTRKPVGTMRVALVEKMIAPPNIYHVSLEFKTLRQTYVTEIGKDFQLTIDSSKTNTYHLPRIDKSLKDIQVYENIYREEGYLLGFNDCRHYCNKMLNSIYEVDDESCLTNQM